MHAATAAESLVDEVLTVLPGQSTLSSQSAPLLEAVYNADSKQGEGKTGIWHKVARGPPQAEMSRWISSCGWRYGRGRRPRLAPMSEVPRANYKLLCDKCFPDAKARCLEAIAASGTLGV